MLFLRNTPPGMVYGAGSDSGLSEEACQSGGDCHDLRETRRVALRRRLAHPGIEPPTSRAVGPRLSAELRAPIPKAVKFSLAGNAGQSGDLPCRLPALLQMENAIKMTFNQTRRCVVRKLKPFIFLMHESLPCSWNEWVPTTTATHAEKFTVCCCCCE